MREYPIPSKYSAEIKTIFWLSRLMIMVNREGTDAVLPRAQQETTLEFIPLSLELHNSLYS